MSYSIRVLNESTGEEELFQGDNVDSVHKEIAENILFAKKCYNFQAEFKRKEKEVKKDLAIQTTKQIVAILESKKQILTKSINSRVKLWEVLRRSININFEEPLPQQKDNPIEPEFFQIPIEPDKSDEKYIIKKLFRDNIFKTKYLHKKLEAQKIFEDDLNNWEKLKIELEGKNQELKQAYGNSLYEILLEYEAAINDWEIRKNQYEENQKRALETINKLRIEYLDKEVQAVETYNYELLKIASESRDYYPYECEVIYSSSNKMLAVEYLLPSIDSISSVCEVRYITAKDTFEEKHLNKKEFTSLYDESIYQLTLSVINEIFKYDESSSIDSIIFNGYVNTIDKSTGENIRPYILSLFVSKSEFNKINLSQVDVKQCFKNLKGISAAELASQTAIAPVIKIDKNDKRFIEGKDIVNSIDDSINIAAMDWEDFEHLVRELFEKEFSKNGGEVKVTRASRDGGVDAIAFDPDPIRGGKIVIQAKRYTNTVGVAAVRDLYGTLLNEGATKGILVTTSDYGSDAYNFAKGKPITLLNGSNLLYLLEQHGHKAKIDINEAKKILGEKER